jgi:hypothetical protein
MTESRKTLIIVVAVVAILLAIYSGWRTFGGSGRSGDDRKNGVAGPISPMSSMLGPDASGKPQTQVPPGGPPPSTQSGQGVTPMQRMMGPSGQPR